MTTNNLPLIQLFDLGLTLPTSKMILGHSVNFPLEGLQYSSHRYSFRSASNVALTVDVDTPFVGVNRSSRLNDSEAFGIQSHATGTDYGGMYIRTDGATAKPHTMDIRPALRVRGRISTAPAAIGVFGRMRIV